MPDLSPEDRYLLRKAQMDADRKVLETQKVQQELDRLVLNLEYKYGLLATGQTIDPRTALIEANPAARKGNGKGSTQELEEAKAHEAIG